MMKTAISVLQEMMMKLGQIPEYEYKQSGPQHQAMFECRCKTAGESVTALARSKKEAKQEAARRMLNQLFHARGMSVPPPYARPPSPAPPSPEPPSTDKALPSTGPSASASTGAAPAIDVRSYVALLKELCAEYKLGEVQYELVGDAGPPHRRQFTVRARLAQHERSATSTTKKAARQLASEALYKYLRENLARLTTDFVEEEAMARAHEKAMERYVEQRGTWRAPLGQRVADYHLGLLTYIDAEKLELEETLEAISITAEEEDPVSALSNVAGALGLQVENEWLETQGGGSLCVVRLEPTAPPLAHAAAGPHAQRDAHARALRYLRRALARTRLATHAHTLADGPLLTA
ncbi:RISC-loading complex subunit TARBP2-like isoform X1 [Colias croceus]|uniref:RISC-loading complex subunit TARBP2-like isoform X1 n=1 Tax=Colias crocea TaxID=72248 RepID=UPI001E27E956|nr:RISC-loading complex subunit TARBP2-like isoform X1 [Colias croceus]XP_045492717.1 RISC-loading complex subunit TARBP2-like isoform X1 [Colias croceus]